MLMFHKYIIRPEIEIYMYECHTPISIEKGNVGGSTKQYDEYSVAKNGCEKSGAEKKSVMKESEGDGSSANPMGMANEGDYSGDRSDVIKLIAGVIMKEWRKSVKKKFHLSMKKKFHLSMMKTITSLVLIQLKRKCLQVIQPI